MRLFYECWAEESRIALLSDIEYATEMAKAYQEADELYLQVLGAIRSGTDESELIFSAAGKAAYRKTLEFYQANRLAALPAEKDFTLQNLIQSTAQITKGSFLNLSNTHVIGFRSLNGDGTVRYSGFQAQYVKTVDQAIIAMAAGREDFDSVMCKALRDTADSGIRVVDFESGYSRRLDSQLRQNILDGVRDIWQANYDRVGREIGADGVEITAHAGCAPDHLPYQGRQYSYKEFEKLQNSLERPFGMWNCRHRMDPILLGVSRPAYSEKELQELERLSTETIEFDGKKYTRYEATQLQRRLETEMRKSKDRALLAKETGVDLMRRVEQTRLNHLKDKYVDLSRTFQLPYKSERMSVSGFKAVKVLSEKLETKNKILGELGIQNVDLKGISDSVVKDIEKAVTDFIKEYPQLEGFLQTIRIDSAMDAVARAGLRGTVEELEMFLEINPALVSNTLDIEKMIKEEVLANFWTNKNGVCGIIKHEMAHLLEYSQAFIEAGVDISSINPDDLLLKRQALNVIKNREISERIVTQAFANLELTTDKATIVKEVSEYAFENFSETFAEAISDADKKRVSVEIIKLVKGWQ